VLDRFRSGEDWTSYLRLLARLHAYSPANLCLITAQHRLAYNQGRVPDPEPSVVAGYRTWKALGRSVERGQSGYAIFAPVTTAVRRPEPDPAGELEAEGDAAAPAHAALRGFRIAYVWELTQTTGPPLPEPPRPKLLDGRAPAGLEAQVAELVRSRGYAVNLEVDPELLGGANGRTNVATKAVQVRAGLDEAARAKTLLHEAGHVLLHAEGPGQVLPRATKEVEAESVAFVVAAAHGMDTSDYSFAYVAAWAGPEGAKAVAATQARVAEAARTLIALSPAPHEAGGRPRGALPALEAQRGPFAGGSARVAEVPAAVAL
jgi:hypothetical protein